MKKKFKVAAAGVGADDFQPADTPTKAPATSGKSFFDLAPEIRNEIYHHLFDDLKVTVQKKDTDHFYPGRPPVRTIVRQRMMGLNIIFVSKQCYAEARPILLSAAEFNIVTNRPSCDLSDPGTTEGPTRRAASLARLTLVT